MQTVTITRNFHLDNAIACGEAMHGIYESELVVAGTPNLYFVQHKVQAERCYCVDTTPGKETCQCQQFAKTGVPCKHIYFANQCERIEEGEAAAMIHAGYEF